MPDETPLTKDEWLRRYKQRFIDRADLTPMQAEACANAADFAVRSDGFENEPEYAADEEMSYWDDDGDGEAGEARNGKA